ATARSYVADAGGASVAGEGREVAAGEGPRREAVREVVPRREVGRVVRGRIRHRLGRDRRPSTKCFDHLDRDRQLLGRPVEAVDADDVRTGAGELLRRVGRAVTLVRAG